MAFAKFNFVNQSGQTVEYNDTLTVIGQLETNDTVIYDTLINKETKVNTLTLPLSYGETTRFIFKYNRQGQDVITIKHRNIPYFINLDCGTMMFYEVLEATSTNRMMDSLVTTNPNIDNNEKKTLSYILRLLMLSSVLLASPDAWGQIHKSGAQLPSTQDKEKKHLSIKACL